MTDDTVTTDSAPTPAAADTTPAADPLLGGDTPAPAADPAPAATPAPPASDPAPAATPAPAQETTTPAEEPAKPAEAAPAKEDETPLLGDGTDGKEPEKPEGDPDDVPWYVGRTDPAMENYWKRYKTLEDALTAQANLVKMQGQMVKMPDKLATAEELSQFYDKMGRPKSPDQYKLDRDFIEGLDDDGVGRINGFLEDMHANGARQETVEAAVNWFVREAAAAESAAQAELAAKHQAALDELKIKWPGNAYTTNVDRGIKALQAWAPPEMAKALAETELADGTKLGKSPHFIELMFNVGMGMADAASPINVSGGFTQQFSKEELDAMLAESMDKRGTPEGAALRKKYEDAIRADLERKGENHVFGPNVPRPA